ncbi:MAG: hypothetical protein K9J21_04775, partial [Bacteroidales bacterium]|nr:hypothetical protein [Bacteroidales bacterium]
MKKLLPFISFILLFGFLGAQNVVFHEGFEQPSGADSVTAYSSSGTNTWGISTDLAAGGLQSDSAVCSPNDTLTLTTDVFSTTGNSFVTLDFDHIAKIETFDKAIIEVSIDNGASWTKLDSTHYMGSSSSFGPLGNVFNANTYADWKSSQIVTPDNSWWKHETFNVSSIAADESTVQVRFSLIDVNGLTSFENYGWFLDNIEIAAATSELVPPVVNLLPPIKEDTIYESSPQTVQAVITDNSGIDTAKLVYYINGALEDTLGMTNFAGDTFTVDIPFAGYGRTVTWFLEATDGASAANVTKTSNYSYFLKYLPQNIVQVGTGSTSADYPFYSFYEDSRTQILYTAAEIQAQGGVAGVIDQLAFDVTSNASASLSGFNIDMKHTSLSDLSGFSSFDENSWTNVYSGTYTVPGTGWQKIDLQNGFSWDGTSNILINICFDNDSWTSSSSINSTSASNMTYHEHTDNASGCSLSSGGLESNRPNIQFRINVPSSLNNDVGVVELTNPTGGVLANSDFDVKSKIKNFGIDTITSADINWQLDGILQSTYSYTGNLEPDSISSELTLGTANVSQGAHNLKLWTDNPNGNLDDNIANDTLHFTFYGCASLLSGTYTIGGSSPDYATFTDAALALNQCGIDGAVTFNVAAGTYSEQITLSDINGASATNTITFQSATGDSSDVTLQYTAANAGENHVVKLEGTSYITFKDMTFKSQDNTWPRVFAMNSGADNISLTNNRFEGVDLSGGTSAADSALVIVEDSIGNGFTFTNNYLQGGTHGLNISGNGINNVTVTNNEFINQWSIGARINGANAPEVKNNLVETNSMSGNFNGILLANANGTFVIAYNEVYAPSTIIGYGLRVESSIGDSLNHAQVYNNMATVRGVAGSTTISAGIINKESRFIDYYYNTFRTIGADELATPLCLYDNTPGETRYLTIKNNIFANNTKGHIIYAYNIDTAGFDHDYNNYYQTGSNLFGQFNGSDVDDFASFQSMTGQEANSVQYDPYFADTTDLHVANNFLNNLGTPISGITVDIDGDSRDASNPDMGADEFDASPYDLAVLEVYGPQNSCGLSSAEDITLKVKNIGTSNINSFDASYMLLNDSTTVTETVNTTINAGDTLEYTFSATVDMDMSPFMVDSTFDFKAWTDHNSDPVPQNDSAATSVLSQYQPPAPTASNYSTNYGDSVTITATSNDTLVWYETDTSSNNIAVGKYYTTPQLYDTTTYWVSAVPSTGKQPIITEICHYQTSTGSPTGGWPTYLVADDYIEITGSPGADLEGITLEQWDENSLHNSHTFPKGTVLGPNGTAIIAIGTASSSTPSPSDYYYHGDVSEGFSSGEEAGRILKNDKGEIIDAVGYGGYSGSYSFPAAAGVTSADWSGNTPSANSTCGNRLEGPYTKDATNWINSGTSPQDPNTKNAGLILPNALSECESPRIPVTVNVTGIPTEDAGPVAMISPASAVQEGSQQYIDLEVKNYAVDPLTSLDISWELDGVHQKTYSWSGNINYKDTDTIRIDTASFTGGGHDIRFYTSQPNGTADTINSNDTLTNKFTACLHGMYT